MVHRIALAFALPVLLPFAALPSRAEVPLTTARNLSTPTVCAEEDNINIPISGNVSHFVIEATHPTYAVGLDNCQADFSNCPSGGGDDFVFSPGEWKLYDDGTTVVVAVRLERWWRPDGMSFSVDGATPVEDVHYVRIHRGIEGSSEYPEFFVLYMDGNLRLIPHPPLGRPFVCYGSSVLVGPAPAGPRPVAEIASARYLSSNRTLEVSYAAGGSATLRLSEVDRNRALVTVDVAYPTEEHPHGPAEHEVVAPPAVVGAVAVRDVGPAEVRGGECRHRVGDAELGHGRVEGGERAVELGEQAGMDAVERGRSDLASVRVVALGGAEEDLPAQAQRLAHGDELRGHLELLAKIRLREHGGERRRSGECPGEQRLAVERAAEDAGVGALEKVSIAAREQAANGVRGGVGALVRGDVGVEAHRPLRRDLVLRDEVADLEGVGARDRDGHRDARVLIERVQQVRHAPAPARACRLVRQRGLPVHGLVTVREELRRHRRGSVEVLRAGERRHERPHVRDQRGPAGVEQPLDSGQARMEPPLPRVAWHRNERAQGQQRALWQSQGVARRRVLGVVGGEAVVAAVEHPGL